MNFPRTLRHSAPTASLRTRLGQSPADYAALLGI